MTDRQPIGIGQLASRAEVSPEALESICSDNDLRNFADLCDETWELIAYELKLTPAQISAIKDDNRLSAEVQRLKFLIKWKETELEPTYEKLVEAFLKCNKVRQALEICRTARNSFECSVSRSEEQQSTSCHQDAVAGGSDGQSHSQVLRSVSETRVRETLRNLDRQFSDVQQQFMRADGVTLEELKFSVATLSSFQSETPSPLFQASNKMEFFHSLKAYCTAQDSEILEDLITALGDEETKRKMNIFNQECKEFQRVTKLKDLVGVYEGPENIPPEYKELEFKLGENWHMKTIQDLKDMKYRLSNKLWLLKFIEGGSVVVTYLVPNSERLLLDQREYLHSQNVLQITMGGQFFFKRESKCLILNLIQVILFHTQLPIS